MCECNGGGSLKTATTTTTTAAFWYTRHHHHHHRVHDDRQNGGNVKRRRNTYETRWQHIRRYTECCACGGRDTVQRSRYERWGENRHTNVCDAMRIYARLILFQVHFGSIFVNLLGPCKCHFIMHKIQMDGQCANRRADDIYMEIKAAHQSCITYKWPVCCAILFAHYPSQLMDANKRCVVLSCT